MQIMGERLWQQAILNLPVFTGIRNEHAHSSPFETENYGEKSGFLILSS